MSEPGMDPERLAALLDGTLDTREREALLAALVDSDDARDTLADAAAILREMEAAGEIPDDLPEPVVLVRTGPHLVTDPPDVADDDVVVDIQPPPEPLPPPRPTPIPPVRLRWSARRWTGMLAAAVVLGAVGLTLYQRATGPAFDDPRTLVALLPATAPAPGAPGWSVMRGDAIVLKPRARAVRVGATLAGLELARRAHDSVAVRTAGLQAAALLGDVAGAAPVAQIYRRVADSAGTPATQLDAVLHEGFLASTQLLDSADLGAGVWLAAARAAAGARDAAFFRGRASRRSLDAIVARSDLDAEQRAAADRVRAVARGDGVPDWDQLGRDLGALLAALGS